MAEEGGTQLFLVVETGQSALDRLTAALAAAPVASVLIVPPAGQKLDTSAAELLIQHAQSRGAAALVFADPDLARRLQADGVHLPHGKDIESQYRSARQIVGPGAIVGVHAGKSRHDAMMLAEAGADYVAFGVPEGVQDYEAARERRLDLVAWWAEIFEVPCVALDVESTEDAAQLAEAGADFVGLAIGKGEPLADIGGRIKAMAEAVAPAPAD